MSWIKKHNKNTSEFILINTTKYVGKWPILCRSQWERMFCQFLDMNKNVVAWSSENIVIRYLDPLFPGSNKTRRYYPDFWFKNFQGEQYIIEVKPLKETKPPVQSKRKSYKTILTEQRTWETNKAKFKAAEQYAQKMGMKFLIMTERELFNK